MNDVSSPHYTSYIQASAIDPSFLQVATSAVFLPSRYRLKLPQPSGTGPFVCLYVVVRHTHACTACPPVCVQPQTWTLAWIWFFKNRFIRISVFCQNVSQIKFMFPLKNIKQVVCCPTPLLSSVLLRASKSTDKATNWHSKVAQFTRPPPGGALCSL